MMAQCSRRGCLTVLGAVGRYAANPGLTPSFRRSLPETGCLSQGLPHGKRYAWPCPPKTLSTRAAAQWSAMKLEIELEIPDGAVDKDAQDELIRSVKEQTALKLYSDERVTTGEAAGMLGLTRIQFLEFSRRTGLGFQVELDDEDFAQIRRWREDHFANKK